MSQSLDEVRVERMADLFLGTPFVKGGRDIKAGLDCFGLIIDFHRAIYGIEIRDCLSHPDYDRTDRHGTEVASALLDEWPTVRPGDQKPGDLVVLSLYGLGVDHVGILLMQGMMLHTRQQFGCIRSRISEVSDRIVRYARHRDRAV